VLRCPRRLISVQNPYGCGDTSTLSMYRRPLPSTNLKFLSTVMFDGRESSPKTGTPKITYATNPSDLLADLAHQVIDATTIHAQAAAPPTPQQVQDIVNFEMQLRTAQAIDFSAGFLNADGRTAVRLRSRRSSSLSGSTIHSRRALALTHLALRSTPRSSTCLTRGRIRKSPVAPASREARPPAGWR
jgi:hypothetical protein